MPITIGILSIKGGVGKTTIAASLASDLVNHFGKKVLLVDANYGAPNLGLHMDIVSPEKTIHEVLAHKAKIKSAIHNRFGVDVIPGSYVFESRFNPLKLKNKIKKIKQNYDLTIIDSSPSLNLELLSAILASDALFLVTTPDYPTLSCSLRAAKLAKQRGRQISGIILNKTHRPSYELSMEEIEQVANIPIIAKIPYDKSSAKAIFMRIPPPIYNKKSKFSKEISNLSAALAYAKEKRSLLNRLFSNLNRVQVNRQIFKEKFHNASKI